MSNTFTEVWEGDTEPVQFDLSSDDAPIDTAGVSAHRLVATDMATMTRTILAHTLAAHGVVWTRAGGDLPHGDYWFVAELTDATGIHTYPSADVGPLPVRVKADLAP